MVTFVAIVLARIVILFVAMLVVNSIAEWIGKSIVGCLGWDN